MTANVEKRPQRHRNTSPRSPNKKHQQSPKPLLRIYYNHPSSKFPQPVPRRRKSLIIQKLVFATSPVSDKQHTKGGQTNLLVKLITLKKYTDQLIRVSLSLCLPGNNVWSVDAIEFVIFFALDIVSAHVEFII